VPEMQVQHFLAGASARLQPIEAASRPPARFSTEIFTSRCKPSFERFSHGSASAWKSTPRLGGCAALQSHIVIKRPTALVVASVIVFLPARRSVAGKTCCKNSSCPPWDCSRTHHHAPAAA